MSDLSEADQFLYAALAAEVGRPSPPPEFHGAANVAAPATASEARNMAANDTVVVPPVAVAVPAAPVADVPAHLGAPPLIPSTPAIVNNPANTVAAPLGTVGGNTPAQPASQQRTRKYRNVGDEADPFICPGLNQDCYHAVLRESGYWDHIFRKHNYTRKQMDRPNNQHIKDIFVPARRASWYQARGVDITYQGTEPKQIAVRRRMAAGLRTTDPAYASTVYGSTMTEPDV
ncbi:hypothetical protein G647_05539 [Cladophialophora carrionii CBS 160.54]|uniref:Uncharacterized protein n=1 Tax=Cladophialophora carrionii CBS 160.54 TaxID=1279043 RepID=V9D9Y2_9EURO|nr:uncharacterized protein G647_05539 [Cladophialophora carrionii CBS 160.54]ETI23734.1 hypothetical protein G647_05539 [Cladophialophora carrionii CBS 160.54]